MTPIGKVPQFHKLLEINALPLYILMEGEANLQNKIHVNSLQ